MEKLERYILTVYRNATDQLVFRVWGEFNFSREGFLTEIVGEDETKLVAFCEKTVTTPTIFMVTEIVETPEDYTVSTKKRFIEHRHHNTTHAKIVWEDFAILETNAMLYHQTHTLLNKALAVNMPDTAIEETGTVYLGTTSSFLNS